MFQNKVEHKIEGGEGNKTQTINTNKTYPTYLYPEKASRSIVVRSVFMATR